jgi:Protein of unknown function (DUF4242)
MPEFLVELYLPRMDAAVLERARAGAELLTREGTPVHYVRSIFVPEDETCFLIYEAASPEAVRAAAGRAALRFERVLDLVTTADGGSGG